MCASAVNSVSVRSLEPSFGVKTVAPADNQKNIKKEKPIKDDVLLPANFLMKTKASVKTAENIPSYVNDGLKGVPNFNFYQFIQISKIPYYLGGPGLVATILAGKNLLDIKANKSAGFNAKGMALGCALYYIMASVAKKCVDVPIKVFRGVDLNQPLADVVENKPETASGEGRKRVEYHNLYESSKFIRWDLMYDEKAENHQGINKNYNKIAKKMGLPENSNDSDSSVRPVIMSMIKKARGWEYIIGAFGVMIGVGIGNQPAMKDEFATGMFRDLKQRFYSLIGKTEKIQKPRNAGFEKSMRKFKLALKTKIARPLKESFVALWKGNEGSFVSKHFGKVAILGFASSVLASNISILASSNLKHKTYVELKEDN